jgi:hypothetical protein
MLRARDVSTIEGNFIDVLEHIPGRKDEKQEYFGSLNIRVPKTNYEVMWGALKERLHASGAASAVFECLRARMPTRLKELLQRSRRGSPVALRANEPAIVGDFFFQNGHLRRIGEVFFEYLESRRARLSRGTFTGKAAGLPANGSGKEYEIALSFAGEDRSIAEEVAHRLHSQGVRVFYDAFEQADMLGKDLAAHLAGIYKDRAQYCAMFISAHYVRKAWPQLERQHAQARALTQQGEYILPIRLDAATVPGLSPTIGYFDARGKAADEIAEVLLLKIRKANRNRR